MPPLDSCHLQLHCLHFCFRLLTGEKRCCWNTRAISCSWGQAVLGSSKNSRSRRRVVVQAVRIVEELLLSPVQVVEADLPQYWYLYQGHRHHELLWQWHYWMDHWKNKSSGALQGTFAHLFWGGEVNCTRAADQGAGSARCASGHQGHPANAAAPRTNAGFCSIYVPLSGRIWSKLELSLWQYVFASDYTFVCLYLSCIYRLILKWFSDGIAVTDWLFLKGVKTDLVYKLSHASLWEVTNHSDLEQ